MSFTATVKEEICAGLSKKSCCRRALLMGILYMRGSLCGDTVQISLVDAGIFDITERLVAEQFSREPRRMKRRGTVASYMTCFYSESAVQCLHELDKAAPEQPIVEKCNNCRRHFLCGCFLAAGRITDPEKGYLLEFSCGERRDALAGFLRSFALNPKYTDRRTEKLLYFRDSTSIEDFFTHAGVMGATFSVMNSKIGHEMRNNANRIANCDTNNIHKTVSAAMRLNELIKRLIEENKLSFLSPELESTARLRLQYPDASLTQLAALADPPMTKSGLNNRLKKIKAAAEELLNVKKEEI